jgi:anthranilate phosphoribosyltransferase
VLVVHGEDGMDEASLGAPTRTWMVADGVVAEGRLTPQELGLNPATLDQVAGGEVTDNVSIFNSVMAGGRGPHADLVALNAGLALWVSGAAADAAAGVALAQRTLADGMALATFERYRALAGAPA